MDFKSLLQSMDAISESYSTLEPFAVQIINDFDEVVLELVNVPYRLAAAVQDSDFDAVQWLADFSRKDPNLDMTTIEKMVFSPNTVPGFSRGHVIEVQQYLDDLKESVHKGTYGTSHGKEDVRDQYGHKIGKVNKDAETKKDEPKRTRGRPTKAAKDEHGNDIKHDTSGIQSMLGGKPKGKVGKVSAKHKLKDWIEAVEANQLNEDSNERPYVCVHAKKGKCEVKATSSYEAAKKAAAKWGLKSTSGIDAYVADTTHSASNLEEDAPMNTQMLASALGKTPDQMSATDKNNIAMFAQKTLGAMTANPQSTDKLNSLLKTTAQAQKMSNPTTNGAQPSQTGQSADPKVKADLDKMKQTLGQISPMHESDLDETSYSAKDARAGKDIGKPGKNFSKIAKDAGKRYGSKAAGERVAGAVLNKLRHPSESVEEGAKVDRMVAHVKASEKKAGHSDKEAENIAWATANKRGMLDNKNKKSVKESVTLDENTDSLEHIISRFKHEVKSFLKGAEMDNNLYDALYDYYMHSGEMPYGVAKAREGDPHEWVASRFEQDSAKHVQQPSLPFGRDVTDENSFDNFRQDYQTANTPHPLAPNARRNAEIAKATPQKTPWSKDPIAAATDRATGFLKTLRSPFKESTDMKDKQFESWEKQLNTLLNEGITVSSSTGQQGSPDSVSVNATDADAEKLLSALRQSGIGVFGGEENKMTSPSAYGAPQHEEEPGHGTETPASPAVVGDGDDMMALIKKMSGIEGGSSEQEPEGTLEIDYEPEEGEEEEVSEGLDPVKEVKKSAIEYMQSTGIRNVHDLDAEAIQYIGDENQINYEEVCKILGCELPAELGPVNADDEEVDEGNAFTGALAKAKKDGIQPGEKMKVGGKEYPVKEEDEHEHEDGETCNECGMYECDCSSEEQVEESYANSDDDKAFQDLQYMLQTLAGGLNKPKHSQATGNIQKVTMEDTLMKDSANLLSDWQKLSGIK